MKTCAKLFMTGDVSSLRRALPLDRALTDLRSTVHQVEPRIVAPHEAVGQILAKPIEVSRATPAQAIALRDGWAVGANDVVGASSYSPVVLAAPPPWIETGECLPPGTDAVLPPDDVALQGGVAEIMTTVAPGEGVRAAGADAAAGATLRAIGERVRPLDAAVALAAGIDRLCVRQAYVQIVSLPGAAALAVAAELVARLIEAAGGIVERACPLSRDAAAIAAVLKDGSADLRIVVGGTGFGRGDHAAAALTASGSLIAHGLALRPGETAGCGMIGETPVILVPRRLDAALAVTLAVVLPCLHHLAGAKPPRPHISGPLTRKVASSVGMTEIVLLRGRGEELEPLAAGDWPLAAMAAAEAWLAVHPDSEGFAKGETVAAFLL